MPYKSPLKSGRSIAAAALMIATGLAMPAAAQLSNVDLAKARAHFASAQAAFKSGNYSETLEALAKAEEISGETGARLLSLEARALYRMENYERALAVIDEFYASGPSDADKMPIDKILLDIDAKIEAERERKRADEAARLEAAIQAPFIEAENARKAEFLRSQPFNATSRLRKPGSDGSPGQSGSQGRAGAGGRVTRAVYPIPGIPNSLNIRAHNGDGTKGGNGSDASSGSNGRNGGRVRIRVREVPMEYTAPLGFIEVLDYDSREVLASGYWDFANTLQIDATGGDGGSGGRGGKGGTGGQGANGSYADRHSSIGGDGGPGGDGGDGGRGGNGGDGGAVRIEVVGSVAFKDTFLKNLNSNVNGGAAGSGGSAGSAGDGGRDGQDAGSRRAYRGPDGYKGRSGSSGRKGNKGTSTYTLVSAEEFQKRIDDKEAAEAAARAEADRLKRAAEAEAARLKRAAEAKAAAAAEAARLAEQARKERLSLVSNFVYAIPSGKTAFNQADSAKANDCAREFVKSAPENVDAAPCLRNGPIAPGEAQYSGYCNMRFTVDQQGHTRDIVATGCTESVFLNPSRAAINTWFYQPRVENGKIVERPGIENRIVFRMSDPDGSYVPESGQFTEYNVPDAVLDASLQRDLDEFKVAFESANLSRPDPGADLAALLRKPGATIPGLDYMGAVPKLTSNQIAFLVDGLNIETRDSEAVPVVRIPPILPRRADASGHCIYNLSVSAWGQVTTIDTVGCTERVFDRNAKQSLRKWVYQPARQGGKFVQSRDENVKITFKLTDERGRVIPEPSSWIEGSSGG